MLSLQYHLIRLGSDYPELQTDLRPILDHVIKKARIEIPPALYAEISHFVKDSYLRKLYQKASSGNSLANREQILNAVEDLLQDKSRHARPEKTFEVNLSGWGMLSRLGISSQELNEDFLSGNYNLAYLNVEMVDKLPGALGRLELRKNPLNPVPVTLKVRFPEPEYFFKPHEIQRILIELDDVVRHELIHFVQILIGHFKDIKEGLGGLPRQKIRQRGEDPYGNKEDSETAQHSLRDVEFYSMMDTEIQRFERFVSKGRLSRLRTELASYWVGAKKDPLANIPGLNMRDEMLIQQTQLPSIYFEQLFQKDKDRWKEAVRVFMREVL